MLTAPAVWSERRADLGVRWGQVEHRRVRARRRSSPRLSVAWEHATPGTSPILAGGLLYVYDPSGGKLVVYQPTTGQVLDSLPAPPGHWNSPIIVAGRIVLPEGNANDHASTGTIVIYRLPGR